ncbi:hypothetical protein EJB05_29775 [Eragrostis curvula]|uniref:Protein DETOXIFICATION n=1 Tax=Eragrostis curvula TaxID=38414 RepID=A0A5J9UTK7_9POAL|nr:hypothetical protein EJB05_29775 [Eragrostis curvula]
MEKREEERKVPLLEARPDGDGVIAGKVEEDGDDDSSLSLSRRAWEENKKLWVVAGPSIFTRFSSFGVTVISQAFIGHIGATELAAYALVSTVLMRFSNGILLAFVFFGGCPLTWTGFSSAALTDLGAIIKLSLSSGVMLCLELWYNTILVLLTGYMKNAEIALDALSICLNINGWEMMISIGFLAATGVRVANELGAGSARRAKFAIVNVVLTSFSIGFVLFVLFLFFRGSLAYIFTESQEVANAVADLSPLLAFSILLNSVQPVLSGVAVGAGWQSVVAYVNVTSYYLIGIPLGAILGYVVGFHVKGIWIGMLLGTLVQTIVLLFITLKTDWEKQVEIAQERLKRWYMEENRRLQASRGNA